jgi:hypothetical protein
MRASAWQAAPSLPVLYFNIYDENGTLVTSLHTLNSLLKMSESTNSYIIQGDDPFYGYPSFFVHPCNTGDLLKKLRAEFHDEETVLLMWLTSFARALGVTILPDSS